MAGGATWPAFGNEDWLTLCASDFSAATIAGSPSQIAVYLEDVFVATGERGSFMIALPPARPRDRLDVVEYPVLELQRRGRFRATYIGQHVAGKLAGLGRFLDDHILRA